jgi:tRNA/rRNA methyltransferase
MTIVVVPVLLMCVLAVRTRFILTQTLHPGNVGAAARAMKTMGFDELVLVKPHDLKVLNRKKTKESASGALNVLEGARICESLDQALEGIDVWCATGMPNDMARERAVQKYAAPRPFLQDLVQPHHNISSIAIVFGNEKVGMTQADLELCHVVLGIPTNPNFGSLNLASAVQLIAYDWRQALGGYPEAE